MELINDGSSVVIIIFTAYSTRKRLLLLLLLSSSCGRKTALRFDLNAKPGLLRFLHTVVARN
jgi:hypothetical protein